MGPSEPRDPPPYETVNNCVLPRPLQYDVEEDVSARLEGEEVTVGWTDSAQAVTGSILYVEYMREPGDHLEAGAPIATVEAAKWMGTVRAPFVGELLEINDEIEGRHGVVHPVNRSPYHAGWIAKLEPEASLDECLESFFPVEEAVEAYADKMDRLDLDACVHCNSFEI
jgi:glycine cleavage system H protein